MDNKGLERLKTTCGFVAGCLVAEENNSLARQLLVALMVATSDEYNKDYLKKIIESIDKKERKESLY